MAVWPDDPITIPVWAVLLVLLAFAIAIGAVVTLASALTAGVALLLRQSRNEWIRSRAIASMSFREVLIAIIAATSISIPLGSAVALYQWSFVAFGATTCVVSLAVSAIILFDRGDTVT
jgi:hypothetical protein